jgi:shikimate kinase
MNIILIGYRASGKSTVGRRLASRMERRFVDTDDLIEERQGSPISDIVKFRGWDHFRSKEKKIIEEISGQDNLVIAPGGGAVLDAENLIALRKNSFIIYLKADCQVLQKRLEQDPRTDSDRPTLTGRGTLEELKEVMTSRDPLYEEIAEVQFDTSGLDVETVVEALLSILQERIGKS